MGIRNNNTNNSLSEEANNVFGTFDEHEPVNITKPNITKMKAEEIDKSHNNPNPILHMKNTNTQPNDPLSNPVDEEEEWDKMLNKHKEEDNNKPCSNSEEPNIIENENEEVEEEGNWKAESHQLKAMELNMKSNIDYEFENEIEKYSENLGDREQDNPMMMNVNALAFDRTKPNHNNQHEEPNKPNHDSEPDLHCEFHDNRNPKENTNEKNEYDPENSPNPQIEKEPSKDNSFEIINHNEPKTQTKPPKLTIGKENFNLNIFNDSTPSEPTPQPFGEANSRNNTKRTHPSKIKENKPMEINPNTASNLFDNEDEEDIFPKLILQGKNTSSDTQKSNKIISLIY